MTTPTEIHPDHAEAVARLASVVADLDWLLRHRWSWLNRHGAMSLKYGYEAHARAKRMLAAAVYGMGDPKATAPLE